MFGWQEVILLVALLGPPAIVWRARGRTDDAAPWFYGTLGCAVAVMAALLLGAYGFVPPLLLAEWVALPVALKFVEKAPAT